MYKVSVLADFSSMLVPQQRFCIKQLEQAVCVMVVYDHFLNRTNVQKVSQLAQHSRF